MTSSASNRAYMRRRREAARDEGVCQNCTKRDARPGRTTCDYCAKQHSKRLRIYRESEPLTRQLSTTGGFVKPTYEQLLAALERIRDRGHEPECKFQFCPLSECPTCPTASEIAESVIGPAE